MYKQGRIQDLRSGAWDKVGSGANQYKRSKVFVLQLVIIKICNKQVATN